MTKEELLRKLFHDQLKPEEFMILMDILKQDSSPQGPEHMLERFQELQEEDKGNSNVKAFERIRKRMMEEIAAKEVLTDETHQEINTFKRLNRTFFSFRISYLIAASIILVALIGTGTYQFWGVENTIIRTYYGQIKEITLPDGSQVSLNGNSSLSFRAANWQEEGIRQVFLAGEAFFHVKKSLQSPRFQVITAGLKVEVLGTAFNVNQRTEKTAVYLEEGKVKVALQKEQGKNIILKPGELLTYSSQQDSIGQPIKVTGLSQTSWKEGMLMFKEQSVSTILAKLTEANQIQFQIEDSTLMKAKLTISIPTEDMDEAMSVLSKTTGISISKAGNTFIIRQGQLRP